MKLSSLLKLNTFHIIIIILLTTILLSYFIPYPVNFEGEIYTYKLKWDVPVSGSKTQIIIEEISVREMLIEGLDRRKIKISDKETGQPVEFFEGKYSVQDLKAEGLFHFEAKISRDWLYISIEAEKISFVVIDEKKDLLSYKVGGHNIEAKGWDVPITANAITIGAKLSNGNKSEIFSSSFKNLKISPNSMQFHFVREKGEYISTILDDGNLKLQKISKDIKLSKDDFIKFSPNTKGITKLHTLTLLFSETTCFLAKVSGKASRIKIGSDHKNLQKEFKFNMIEAILGHEIANWLMSAAVGGIIISLLTEIIRKKLFKNNE